jgi:hypothetical protein
MEYKDKKLNTMGQVFEVAINLAKTDKEEAQKFFKLYIEYIFKNNDEVNSLNEAERIAKANFGYFAGYYSQEVCDIIYETYQCSHPIFGNKPFEVNPEDAYKKGLEIGSKLK